jgi:type IX secretion system PorP/SprF family membrane protein
MTRKFLVLFVLGQLLAIKSLAQQDPLYNLYAFNQAMINPAYAGVYNNLNLNFISRLQWIGIDGSPRTNMFSATASVASRAGAGLTVISDQLGINNNQEIQLSGSFQVIEDDGKVLAMGLQAGMINYKYDYTKLNLEYLDDADLDMTNVQYAKPNFGAGIWYMTDLFFVGLSSPRILNVNVNDGVSTSTRYLRHIYISGGTLLNNTFNNTVRVKPSFLLRWVPDGAFAADVSCSVLLKDVVWAGITVRNLSGLGLNGQFQLRNGMRLGYAFELPTNSLISSSFGSHEFSVMIELSVLKTHHKITRYF